MNQDSQRLPALFSLSLLFPTKSICPSCSSLLGQLLPTCFPVISASPEVAGSCAPGEKEIHFLIIGGKDLVCF